MVYYKTPLRIIRFLAVGRVLGENMGMVPTPLVLLVYTAILQYCLVFLTTPECKYYTDTELWGSILDTDDTDTGNTAPAGIASISVLISIYTSLDQH